MKMFVAGFLAGIPFVASVALSLIHPWGDVRATVPGGSDILNGSMTPPGVRQVIENKCADCHSNNTHWPIYSRLAPGSWLMEHDVAEGRTHMNFSRWQQYDPESQIELLSKINAEVRNGDMPVDQYLILHPAKRLTEAERQMIYSWSRAERKRIRNVNEQPGQ